MKEITLFNENEKEIMRPLLKAKEQGDHEAAVKFTEMWIEGCKRALEEYKKQPESEEVIADKSDFFPMTVKEKIAELEEELAINEEWLRKA